MQAERLETYQWTLVYEEIAAWKQQYYVGEMPALHAYIKELRPALAGLLERIQRRFLSAASSQQALVIAIGLAAFGPAHAGMPPAAVWEVIERAAATVPANPQRWLDIVIAVGCGWRRTVQPGHDPWSTQWDTAIQALCSMVSTLVVRALGQLETMLADQGVLAQVRRIRGDEWSTLKSLGGTGTYGSFIGKGLIEGMCSCGNHQEECREHEGLRACGSECCRTEHHLANWEPGVCSLRSFLTQAIYGTAQALKRGPKKPLQTGLFSVGALYRLIVEDIGILIGPVEFKVCYECHGAQIDQPREPRKKLKITDLEALYEGNRCPRPECKTPADRARTYYVARTNWIFVPDHDGGAYEWTARYTCSRCGNLFPVLQELETVRERIEIVKNSAEDLRQDQLERDHEQRANPRLSLLEPVASQSSTDLRSRALKELGRYEAALKQRALCPRCGGKLRQRNTHLWVYAPRGQHYQSSSIEDIPDPKP